LLLIDGAKSVKMPPEAGGKVAQAAEPSRSKACFWKRTPRAYQHDSENV